MKHIVLILVFICSGLFSESAVVRKIVNNSTILTVPHQESPPNTTFSIGMRGPFIGMPSSPNNTIGENLNGTNGYMVLSNGSLGTDRILASALGDNSNGLNTGFGSFGGVGSGMNSLTDNMAFGQPFGSSGQPFGSSGNLFGPGMPTGGGGGGNLFPGYGYGIPGMNVGMNYPGSNGNGYYPGNGFGNNPFPGIIPGYGYGMSPGNWYQPGSPNGNGYGYGYGNWNGNSYGWGNNFGMGVPWYRRAPSDNSTTSTITKGKETKT